MTNDEGRTPNGLPLFDASAIVERAAGLPADLRLSLRTPLRVKARGALIETIDLPAICRRAAGG